MTVVHPFILRPVGITHCRFSILEPSHCPWCLAPHSCSTVHIWCCSQLVWRWKCCAWCTTVQYHLCQFQSMCSLPANDHACSWSVVHPCQVRLPRHAGCRRILVPDDGPGWMQHSNTFIAVHVSQDRPHIPKELFRWHGSLWIPPSICWTITLTNIGMSCNDHLLLPLQYRPP